MSTALLPGFDPVGVLISVRPPFAKLIADGTKTIELRRRFPDLPAETVLVLYATKPTAAVIGIARLHSMTAASTATLWRRFAPATGVSKTTFDMYFEDCSQGVALEVGNYQAFDAPLSANELRSVWPDFSAPQSFRYVPSDVLGELILRASPKRRPRATRRLSSS